MQKEKAATNNIYAGKRFLVILYREGCLYQCIWLQPCQSPDRKNNMGKNNNTYYCTVWWSNFEIIFMPENDFLLSYIEKAVCQDGSNIIKKLKLSTLQVVVKSFYQKSQEENKTNYFFAQMACKFAWICEYLQAFCSPNF